MSIQHVAHVVIGPDRPTPLTSVGSYGDQRVHLTNLGPLRIFIGDDAVTDDHGFVILPGDTRTFVTASVLHAIAPTLSPTPGVTRVAVLVEDLGS